MYKNAVVRKTILDVRIKTNYAKSEIDRRSSVASLAWKLPRLLVESFGNFVCVSRKTAFVVIYSINHLFTHSPASREKTLGATLSIPLNVNTKRNNDCKRELSYVVPVQSIPTFSVEQI